MKVCVAGLWHLGTVTAACLASAGHDVVGLDFDAELIRRLQAGQPPIFEPGLEDLLRQDLASGRLSFTTDVAGAAAQADIVWLAYDTPVDEDDRADIDYVVERAQRLFPHLLAGTLVLISSQLPAGTTRRLEQAYAAAHAQRPVMFAYSPENLRLGKALSIFTQPDRVVVGVRDARARQLVSQLLLPFTEHIEWMSVESAEMTKHALNGFLALSVAFINEVAVLCEQVGADAKEVERGLKSETRIGPKAYLSPGAAFAGGTLARDVSFMVGLGRATENPTPLLAAVLTSNETHRHWPEHKLQTLFGSLAGHTLAIWGLTYKPGTDTLRRSSSVELCQWAIAQGASLQVHDPTQRTLPAELFGSQLCATPQAALAGAEALVIATEWPDYLAVTADQIVGAMRAAVVIDPNRFLAKNLASDPRIRYETVGKARPHV
jgi:UDPglucose 6-dehydrogenase